MSALFEKFFVIGRSLPRGRFVVHTEPVFREDAIEHDQAIIEFIEDAIREKLERDRPARDTSRETGEGNEHEKTR